MTGLWPEREAFACSRRSEDLGIANFGRRRQCKIEDGKLETKWRNDTNFSVRGTEANICRLGAGGNMVPNSGLEGVVYSRHNSNTLGVSYEQQARGQRPLKIEHGTREVLAKLDHVDHAQPTDGSDIDNT
jgi:hypothetical protein